MDLDQSQLAARDLICRARFGLVTGGPGTGKTTTLKAALDLMRGQTVALAAPTGKAAMRMTEATGRPASTVHRLLAFMPNLDGTLGFQRNRGNPLDVDVVIVDEASMLDLALAHALFSAVDWKRTRVILVGDANQLPSVGCGRVFGDLLDAGSVQAVRLTSVHRAAQGSWVCSQAPVLLAGDVPDLASRQDFGWVEVADRDRLVRLALAQATAPGRESQLLVPMRVGPAGADILNTLMQSTVNPRRPGEGEWVVGNLTLRLHDRVIQTKNSYQLDGGKGVFNGETGVVTAIGEKLAVTYPAEGGTREVTYSKADSMALELAYALTIHKSQGSQWPWVIVVCHSTHTRMLTRQLIYTAITRASEGVVIVGDRVGLERAAKEARDGRRNTRLARRVLGTDRREREVPSADPGVAAE